MKKKKRLSLWQILVLLLCIPTFLISAFLFCRELLRYQAEDQNLPKRKSFFLFHIVKLQSRNVLNNCVNLL